MSKLQSPIFFQALILLSGIALVGCSEPWNQSTASKPVPKPLDPSLIRIREDPKSKGWYAITQPTLDAQPRWNPAVEDSPVPIPQLVTIAIDSQISDDLPARQHWRADRVLFRRFSANWSPSAGESYPEDRKARWYVEIHLRYNTHYDSAEGKWWDEDCYAYLLLDGSVIDLIAYEY